MINKFLFIVALPITILSVLIFSIYIQISDLEKAVDISSTILQSLAILMAGFWAYRKLIWEKRAENAIKIKAMLMEYLNFHNEAAVQYRIDQSHKKEDLDCWTGYATRMIPVYNQFQKNIHLALYVPKTLRKNIFDTVWLSINKGRGPQTENLDENWKRFGEEIDKINKQLDDLVSI